MTTSPRRNEILTVRKRLQLLEAAMLKREKQVPAHECFDPVRYIEHTLPKIKKGFDFHYDDEDEEFVRRPNLKAYVDLDGPPRLVARESVVDAAYRGDAEARFILCHEIAHVFLHQKAATILGRHSIGSKEQFASHKPLELQANCFAGALLVPPISVRPGASTFEIRRKFLCSSDVAQRAIEDAERWRRQTKRS